MEQNIFFSALSISILTSIGQGLIVYILTRVLLYSAPDLSSDKKFRFLYGAVVLIFTGFIISLVRTYLSGVPDRTLTTSAPGLLPELAPQKDVAAPVIFGTDYSAWVAGLYFTGLFIQSILILTGLFHLRNIRTSNHLWVDKAWDERLLSLSLKFNIGKKVSLHLAERVFSPFTAGFIKPVIIFPIAILNRLSTEQVEAILLHELAHIKRNDYLLNIIQKIMESVLFFNPFIWLLTADLKREREFACDDLVMKHIPDCRLYARALVHIAESKLKSCALGIAATDNNKFDLFNRIKRLTSMKTENINTKSGLFTLLCITAACLSLAWMIPADTTKKGDTNSSKEIAKPISFTHKDEPEIPAIPSIPPTPPVPSVSPIPAIPPALPIPVLDALPAVADTNELKEYFNSAEWKKQLENIKLQTAEAKKYFQSPEWKKQMEDIKANAADMKKDFESAEWKKQMNNAKANAANMKKHFESPEWKKQMEDIKASAADMKKHFESAEGKKQMDNVKASAADMKKHFESAEWKKQMEDIKASAADMKKHFESVEWKQQLENIKKQAKELKEDAERAENKPADGIR